jgi:pimeloyl-ACP methyl ester carboxylesterase
MPVHETKDGAQIHYRVQGKDTGRPSMVFIHGWCSNLEHWAAQATYFGRNHRVLRIDRRGHGKSPAIGSGQDAAHHAADVAEVARAVLGTKSFIAVGHAGGGPTTLELTRSYPRLVKAVVLVDARLDPSSSPGAPAGDFASRLEGLVEALDGPGGKRALKQMYQSYFHKKCDRELARKAVADALTTPMSVAIDELLGMRSGTSAIADEITKPALWVTTYLADQAYISEHLAKVQFGQVAGAAHFPQMEVPGQVNAMIATFIDQL